MYRAMCICGYENHRLELKEPGAGRCYNCGSPIPMNKWEYVPAKHERKNAAQNYQGVAKNETQK